MTNAKRLTTTMAGALIMAGCATQPATTPAAMAPVAPAAAPQYGLMSAPDGQLEKEFRLKIEKEAHFSYPVDGMTDGAAIRQVDDRACEKDVWIKFKLDLRIEQELETCMAPWIKDQIHQQVMKDLMPKKTLMPAQQWNDMVQREFKLRLRIEIEKEVTRIIDDVVVKKELEVKAELKIKQKVDENKFFSEVEAKLKAEFELEIRKSRYFNAELEVKLDAFFQKIVKIECEKDNRPV